MDNNFSEEEVYRCTLTNPNEIVFQLKSLIKHGNRMSVNFQEGKQSFLTVLLDVSPRDGLFYFDIGGSDEINRLFLKAGSSTFMTIVDGVRIQFSGKACRETKLGGQPVFSAQIPAQLVRLQRRDTFRLPLPSAKPFTCRVRRGTPKEELLSLHDISVGGIGILSTVRLEYVQLEKLENCWLDLRDSGMIRCTLEVRYVFSAESRSGKPLWRMGCRFVGFPPSDETLIQRFMAKVEAERRVLGSGGVNPGG
jgi:c-di-GMP-binding flagellar brake protein YcgR